MGKLKNARAVDIQKVYLLARHNHRVGARLVGIVVANGI